MMFRNPWIDPRVLQVRAADAEAYLRQRGWKSLPSEQANLLTFEAPADDGDPATVRVPLLEKARDYPQRVIELITDLALAEKRYAVQVLDDVLKLGSDTKAANGTSQDRPRDSELANK